MGLLSDAAARARSHSIINGHVDVVPEGDLSQWDCDPFSGRVETDAASGRQRLYGRGVTDMKGGTFAAVLALRALQSCKVALCGDVTFHSVVEEESGGAGTLWLIRKGYGKADLALIPEPSEMKIFPQQQVDARASGVHASCRGLALFPT